MKTFDYILNWQLLTGSHHFPGPDGGTCINEAAIVAAGMKYRAIRLATDCPPCFSLPIAAYAIGLNDSMSDSTRQKLLLPFVTRLAGTASSKNVEVTRATFIVIETVRQILPPILRICGLNSHAENCGSTCVIVDAAAAAYSAAYSAYSGDDAASRAAHYAYSAAADSAASRATQYAAAAAAAAHYAAAAADDAADAIWQIAVDILDRAILMGNHTSIDIHIAIDRLTSAKQLVKA